jgi:hypothetical protein
MGIKYLSETLNGRVRLGNTGVHRRMLRGLKDIGRDAVKWIQIRRGLSGFTEGGQLLSNYVSKYDSTPESSITKL